jgi:hypothetical protein
MAFINTGRVKEYLEYHRYSESINDIDPSYAMLRYVCDRFELNMEQKYWLSFLYSTCYNAATVFYIYNEFPDYLGVDVGRLERWWNAHKHQLDFQTDCRWVRSSNLFVGMYMDYRSLCGESQEETYKYLTNLKGKSPYGSCYEYFSGIKYMGRFKLFLLLEAVHVVTDLPIVPDRFPLEEAQSSRNGLCFALGRDDLLCGHGYGRERLEKREMDWLYKKFDQLLALMRKEFPDTRVDIWNVETSLCAYKKWHRGKRYPGYYITRQAKEIASMEKKVTEGVYWKVLWQFREENYPWALLIEKSGNDLSNLWQPARVKESDSTGQTRLKL